MWARGLLAAYLAVVAVIVLEPSNGLPSSSIVRITDALVSWGAPTTLVGEASVEVVTNVLLFVPLTLLGLFAVQRWPWWAWFGAAVALSVGIEVAQAVLLPARTPSVADVASNAVGAAVGLVVGAPVRRRWRRAAVAPASDAAAGTGTSSARGTGPRRRPAGRSGRAGS